MHFRHSQTDRQTDTDIVAWDAKRDATWDATSRAKKNEKKILGRGASFPYLTPSEEGTTRHTSPHLTSLHPLRRLRPQTFGDQHRRL